MRQIVCLLVVIFLAAGCAGVPRRQQIDRLIAADRCDRAVPVMEESRDAYGANGVLLFLLDSAMVHLQCGRYDTAQRFFHEAERTANRLWTESVSQNAASLLVNDYMRAYPGEDFERAMIHLMSAIGYLQAGDLTAALVETRRLDSLLSAYNTKYVEQNVYKEDAFGRYLSGMLNEDDNAIDDAFIDYLLAARAYGDYRHAYGTERPASLEQDLLRTAAAVDRMEDAQAALGAAGERARPQPLDVDGKGKVVYIQFSGDAPKKVEDAIVIPTGRGPVSLAFPRMVVSPPACGGGRLTLNAASAAAVLETELVEDVNRIAVKNLDDRKGRVVARTLLRAALKQAAIESAAHQTDEQTGEVIRTLLNVLNLFVERADVRSWRTLPGEIHLARGWLPPGTYRVVLSRCGEQTVIDEALRVEADRTHYLFIDTRYGPPGRRRQGDTP